MGGPDAIPKPRTDAHAPRIVLFTDTLADVNGVSRFVLAAARHAPAIHVITSTRLPCPSGDTIHNLPPAFSRPMPGYATIDLAVPSPRAIRNAADALQPGIVHVSTPGPVGMLGRRYALKRGLPLVGTYHTDFPAYIEHLLDDVVLTHMSRGCLRWFYRPFDRVLSRSPGCAPSLEALGIPPARVLHLRPGMDTSAFHPGHRDQSESLWGSVPGARATSTKLLYVGRISTEKNLRLLVHLWPRIRAACRERAVEAQLILVGDGPHRPELERALAPHDAIFAGFRTGRELAAFYSSCDVFIFPSATDTLGQAVMEAQASGLPAIVSDRGGPSGIVAHERTGYVLPLAPAVHANSLWCAHAVRLLTSPDLRALGAEARTRLAPMTIAASLDHFLELHDDVLAQKHKPGHALARGPARR